MIHFILRALLLTLLIPPSALADSSSPVLAAYYDRQMAIVSGKAYAWAGRNAPKQVPFSARQVGVGRNRYYLLTNDGDLISFGKVAGPHVVLMRGVAEFAAGNSGVLAITNDRALWWISSKAKQHLADSVARAAVGDGANYYITQSGDLFVKGLAHRGQYGDGLLKSTKHFKKTASGVMHVSAHTGHAIMLRSNGDVLGTGGNIFGPVGKHGLGDKAVRWSPITLGAIGIATGASHSLAIRRDGALLAWGGPYGIKPIVILRDVAAVAAGSRTTIALKNDHTLWQWRGSQKPARIRLVTGQ